MWLLDFVFIYFLCLIILFFVALCGLARALSTLVSSQTKVFRFFWNLLETKIRKRRAQKTFFFFTSNMSSSFHHRQNFDYWRTELIPGEGWGEIPSIPSSGVCSAPGLATAGIGDAAMIPLPTCGLDPHCVLSALQWQSSAGSAAWSGSGNLFLPKYGFRAIIQLPSNNTDVRKAHCDWLWKVWCKKTKQRSLAGQGWQKTIRRHTNCFRNSGRLEAAAGKRTEAKPARGLMRCAGGDRGARGGGAVNSCSCLPHLPCRPFLLSLSLRCAWYAAHALLLFSRRLPIVQTWTLSEALFCCAGWSHWATVPAFPSCLSSDPRQCRMRDNLLIAQAQRLRHDKAYAPACGCQQSLNVPLTRVRQLGVAQLVCLDSARNAFQFVRVTARLCSGGNVV